MPDNRPATAFYRERRHSEAPRSIMPTSCHDGSGTILSGLMCCTFLYAAKVRKFFFLRRVRRSQQLPAAISCRPKLSPRREKKADVSVQSRGQMDGRHCGVCGNRIYSAAAIWTCYARTHPSNFVSALPAVPTVVQRTFARFGRVSSSCAHGAGRGGGAVVPWHGGTDCTCLWPRRSQREATAARCHSRVHTVWDRKKGRFIATHPRVRVISDRRVPRGPGEAQGHTLGSRVLEPKVGFYELPSVFIHTIRQRHRQLR